MAVVGNLYYGRFGRLGDKRLYWDTKKGRRLGYREGPITRARVEWWKDVGGNHISVSGGLRSKESEKARVNNFFFGSERNY